MLPNNDTLKTLYFQGLKKEWELKKEWLPQKGLVSIYFGGGTPSLLPIHDLESILQWIYAQDSQVEITLEVNPETVTLSQLKEFKAIGINRISLGIQSFDSSELISLSRSHTVDHGKKALFNCADAGFDNVSIDLMIDTPFQTLASWEKTLLQLSELPFTHLSLYNLTIEPHTVFYKKRDSLQKTLPSEEQKDAIFQMALKIIPSLGFERYEISAFSKPGFQSKHNTGYWTNRPFLGFGPSASSDWNGSRFRNISHLHRYCKKVNEEQLPTEFSETLLPSARIKEQLVLGLRLISGVKLEGLPSETLATLADFEEKGLVEKTPTTIKLTEKGLMLHDWIASELIEA